MQNWPFFSVWTEISKADCDFGKKSIPLKLGNIVIENVVWIGLNVITSPGVTIGEYSIIGANSVVIKDVPPFAIMGGVPAKIIRFKQLNN